MDTEEAGASCRERLFQKRRRVSVRIEDAHFTPKHIDELRQAIDTAERGRFIRGDGAGDLLGLGPINRIHKQRIF